MTDEQRADIVNNWRLGRGAVLFVVGLFVVGHVLFGIFFARLPGVRSEDRLDVVVYYLLGPITGVEAGPFSALVLLAAAVTSVLVVLRPGPRLLAVAAFALLANAFTSCGILSMEI